MLMDKRKAALKLCRKVANSRVVEVSIGYRKVDFLSDSFECSVEQILFGQNAGYRFVCKQLNINESFVHAPVAYTRFVKHIVWD